MAEEIKTHDLVIGSRFVRGGGMVDLEVLRIINSKFANLITDKLLGMPFHDCTSGFRCYRVSLLIDNNLEMIIKARRYVFLVELLHFLFKKGYSIKEIPIIFINRLKGETKINISEMIYAAKIILRLIIRSMYTKFMK
jgi:dolichol-phosphate mannosyltransferase